LPNSPLDQYHLVGAAATNGSNMNPGDPVMPPSSGAPPSFMTGVCAGSDGPESVAAVTGTLVEPLRKVPKGGKHKRLGMGGWG